MKYLYIFLFSFPSFTTSFAQVSLDSMLFYDPANGSWSLSGKMESTYLNNRIYTRCYSKNTPTSPWENVDSTSYSYDANGNLIELHNTYWSSSNNTWENSFRHTYTYNGNNLLTEQVFENWDFNTSSWENSTKNEFFYNANGRDTASYGYIWNGAWDQTTKISRTYNSNGNLTLIYYYSWDGSNWAFNSRFQFFYDGQNNDTLSLYDNWFNNAWEPEDREVRVYNSDNYLVDQIDYDWDGTGWILSRRDEFTRDTDNNLLSYLTSYDNNGIWEPSDREVNTYENSYTASNLQLPVDFLDLSYFENGRLLTTTYEGYDIYTSTWEPQEHYEYYYSDGNVTATGEGLVSRNQFLLYPNPATDYFFIDSNSPGTISTTIDDNQVQVVANYERSTQVNIQRLPAGVYLVIIKQDGQILGSQRLFKR